MAKTTEEQSRKITATMESSRNDLKDSLTRMANTVEDQNFQMASMVKQSEAFGAQLSEVKDLAARPRKVQIVEAA